MELTMLRRMSIRGVAFVLSCLLSGATLAATHTPNPPKQLCIGGKCATTVVGGKVKWNPGHYGASAGIAQPGSGFSKFTPEMDDMLKDDWIYGYRLFITWPAIDTGPVTFNSSVGGATKGTFSAAMSAGTYWVYFADGEYRDVTVSSDGTSASWSPALAAGSVTGAHLYTTALLDQILNRLKTQYRTPKQLVIALLPMSFAGGSRNGGDFSRVPPYIATNPKYGPSPDGRTYGWWGPAPGQTLGLYTAATYRPAVAAEYAALGQALGARYDSDPNFEAIMDQEDSAVVQAAITYPPADPSYSDAAYVAQQKMYLAAWLQAFPHTNVIAENTFLRTSTPAQEFEAWMIQNRIAPGTADISGQSYYDAHPSGNLSNWGLAAYAGQTASNSSYVGQDYRGSVRPMVDVEGPDIGSGSGTTLSAAPLDLVKSLNQTVKASHAFWDYAPGGRAPRPKWAQVTAVLKDNPLTNTGYPGNYPN
jgi:hypothetical protein